MYEIRSHDAVQMLLASTTTVEEALSTLQGLADLSVDQLAAAGDGASGLHLPYAVLHDDQVVVRSLIVVTTRDVLGHPFGDSN